MPILSPLQGFRAWQKSRKELIDWERSGRPVPPPHIVKQQVLLTYAMNFRLEVLVETGTFYGDMVDAMKGRFDKVYSIELSTDLYEKAKIRFAEVSNVELIHGDSAIELGKIMDYLDRPALFWLDGHYSAGETAMGSKSTPICEELTHILSAKDLGHVIVIDDARCFGKAKDYPSIEELSDFIKSKRRNVNISIQDDSIRVTPQQ